MKRGVTLVTETAAALEDVTAKVGEIDLALSAMARSAQEQATGLGEVNIAVNRMDQVTQQNAAMLGKATTAAASLKKAAADMTTLIREFRIGGAAGHQQAHRLVLVESSKRPSKRVG